MISENFRILQNSAVGSPDDRDDPYKPVIRLLKEIRKEQRRQHHSGFTNIRDQYDRQGSQFQFASASGGNGGGGSTPYPILTPGNGGGGSSSGFGGSGISSILPSAGGSSSNYPPILPNIPSGSELAGQVISLKYCLTSIKRQCSYNDTIVFNLDGRLSV